MAAQDVRDLTHRKVEDRDASYEILQHSDDGTLAERYRGWSAHRVPEHTQRFLVVRSRVCAMLEQDACRKARPKFAASSALETGLSQADDPQQGARLVRAFLRITDPTVRLAIVQMVEKVGSAAAADC